MLWDWFIVEPRWGSLFLSISTQCALRDTGLWSGTALQFFQVWPPLMCFPVLCSRGPTRQPHRNRGVKPLLQPTPQIDRPLPPHLIGITIIPSFHHSITPTLPSFAISKMASISTVILPGRAATPKALRAPTPASLPNTWANNSLHPLITAGC